MKTIMFGGFKYTPRYWGWLAVSFVASIATMVSLYKDMEESIK